MMTIDGGTTWEYKDVGDGNSYNAHAFLVTPMIAYTIGQYGNSKRTVDGGATWTDCSFSPAYGYSGRTIFASDTDNVFYAGLNNITLVSSFGRMSGSTWLTTEFAGCISMQDIMFIGTTGWMAGNGGTIKRTVDNGYNWTDGASGVTSDIYGMSFKDFNNGWAVTEQGEILKTTDSGITWQLDYNAAVTLFDVTFRNLNGYGYAVGSEGRIYKFDPTLSVNEIVNESDISVYPNPASSSINILNTSGKVITSIEFYNSIGQFVETEDSNLEEEIITSDINLATGIYYLKINFEECSLFRKIIIK